MLIEVNINTLSTDVFVVAVEIIPYYIFWVQRYKKVLEHDTKKAATLSEDKGEHNEEDHQNGHNEEDDLQPFV